jgi:muramoyltetrapeptide carboxypeptidase
MNRKDFFSASASLLAASSFARTISAEPENAGSPIIPTYLKQGDLIGITSPAGYITPDEIQPAIKRMESWGFRILIGDTIGKKDFTFGGTDDERTTDFQKMLDDKNVKAIMCARGGYGLIRILDRLQWEKFKAHPKWIIGFSDVTVLHAHINRRIGVATIHSKMCNSFPADWETADAVQKDTIDSIRKALTGEKMIYDIAPDAPNRSGTAEGMLVGGNLKTLESLRGSVSDINTNGKILFVEDTGEYLYSIDRMFWNLKRSGKLTHLKGLIIGAFRIKTDADTENFGKTLEQIIVEKVKPYNYPVCFGFPVGHQKNNVALKCGVKHRLTVTEKECSLKELR